MHKSLKTQYNNPEVLSFAASAVLHLFFIYFPPTSDDHLSILHSLFADQLYPWLSPALQLLSVWYAIWWPAWSDLISCQGWTHIII